MRVPIPSFWRVNFAANAPGPVADRGEQFFLGARTPDDPTQPSFVFGSAERDTMGDMVYTDLEDADFGMLDTAGDEIVMRLDLRRLNLHVNRSRPVRVGSVLVGLRGQTGTLGAVTARDLTRGGGSFVVCSELVGVGPGPEAEFGMGPPSPCRSPGDRTARGPRVSATRRAAWPLRRLKMPAFRADPHLRLRAFRQSLRRNPCDTAARPTSVRFAA